MDEEEDRLSSQRSTFAQKRSQICGEGSATQPNSQTEYVWLEQRSWSSAREEREIQTNLEKCSLFSAYA